MKTIPNELSATTDTGQGLVPLGFYQHYKGQQYQLIAIAMHSEEQQQYAVYRALYGEFGLWVRPLSMFIELLTIDGATVPRFSFISSTAPS